ncbi:hypothetical protein LOTGIDRAFT_166895 [Lottia gigantea]|uniref:Uncharacterized protein n=1 Tax=Lottia gigantea TaxID=225164 RepID=V3Z714_LOTGI|nr:hypothetical protein LOTGIDRAFT_166895 [Lottia gigantea]ESO86628.1 hypothetical protein LOTGIDRAFT_166895 [Lottia gigantea]
MPLENYFKTLIASYYSGVWGRLTHFKEIVNEIRAIINVKRTHELVLRNYEIKRTLNRLLKKQMEDLQKASRMGAQCDNHGINGNRPNHNDLNNNKTQSTTTSDSTKTKSYLAEYLAGLSLEAMVGKMETVDLKIPSKLVHPAGHNKNGLMKKISHITKADIMEKFSELKEILGESRIVEKPKTTIQWADERGYRLATVQTIRPRLVFADELMATSIVPKSILKKH